MIVPPLLLLAAAVHTGFSYRFIEKDCGTTYKKVMRSGIHTISFIPDSLGHPMLLYQHNATLPNKDSRRKVAGIYFVINGLLKRDSGRYTARERSGKVVFEEVLLVREISKSMTLQKSEELSFSFPLEDENCNIYFRPNEYSLREEYSIVRGGVFMEHASVCLWIYFIRPCGLRKNHMDRPCAGQYEVRDDEDDIVLEVTVDMEEEDSDLSPVGAGLGIFFLASGCCFCMKLCCCRKKSKKKETTDNDANDQPPAERPHQYDAEPVNRTRAQVNQPTQTETRYPPQPSYNPASSLINNPAMLLAPPNYSEVGAPSLPLDPPPLYSEVEPHFELTGFASAPPLSSDSTHCDVYNSDKLNFL